MPTLDRWRTTCALATLLASSACVHQHERAPDTAEHELALTPLPPTPADARVEVRDIVGMTQAGASQWLAPVHEPLASCRPAKPGVLHVAIVSETGGTVMNVVGDSALDGAMRGCILRALSLYDEELLDKAILAPPALPASGDPLDEPPAVSSLVIISW